MIYRCSKARRSTLDTFSGSCRWHTRKAHRPSTASQRSSPAQPQGKFQSRRSRRRRTEWRAFLSWANQISSTPTKTIYQFNRAKRTASARNSATFTTTSASNSKSRLTYRKGNFRTPLDRRRIWCPSTAVAKGSKLRSKYKL